MGLAEALSDDGEVTGRGNPIVRGAITGLATMIGGMLHTLPFLIAVLSVALHVAYGVVVVELLAIAYIRYHFMKSPLAQTVGQVTTFTAKARELLWHFTKAVLPHSHWYLSLHVLCPGLTEVWTNALLRRRLLDLFMSEDKPSIQSADGADFHLFNTYRT